MTILSREYIVKANLYKLISKLNHKYGCFCFDEHFDSSSTQKMDLLKAVIVNLNKLRCLNIRGLSGTLVIPLTGISYFSLYLY